MGFFPPIRPVVRPEVIHPGSGGSRLGAGAAVSSSSERYTAGTFNGALSAWLGTNYGDYGNGSEPLPPIPLEWIIAPYTEGDVAPDCPSASASLGAFAVAALVPVLLLTIFGRRTVVHKLTMGVFGKKREKGIGWTWVIGPISNVLSNLFATFIVHRTDGFEHLRVKTIFMLYSSRPSCTMTFMAILRIVGFRQSANETVGEFVYVDSYISSAIGELIFHTIAAVFIGVTWKRFPDPDIKSYMQDSLIYMEVLPAITLVCIIGVVPIWRRQPTIRDTEERWIYAFVAMMCFATVIAASWVYWVKFLTLPGALWCPPKIYSQTAIWVVFSTLGGFLTA